jgi:FtsP/CotA-like multicopper oxidase with cupredoxin domain
VRVTRLLGALLATTLTSGTALADDPPAPLSSGAPLTAPPVLVRRNGRLHVDLTAAPGSYSIGGERFAGMLYNDAYLPAVWRLKPGDLLTVALHNRLSEPTNLHVHGLHVSPRGHGDNVFLHVAPGESFRYRIQIPHDHDAGLYWFHTHAHGFVSEQIIAGLSGAIIIEGITRRYPMLRDMKERVMLLKHIPHPRADWEELVTLNGQVAPTIAIRPGESQFWRLGNIGADLFLRLHLDGAPMYVIATDGHALLQPRRADDIVLGPGQRAEVVVVGPAAGRHAFRSMPLVLEEGRPPLPEHLLGTLVSSGPAADVAAAQHRVAAARPPPTSAFEALRTSPTTTRRTLVFTRSQDRTRFYINGRLFGEAGTETTIPLGNVEEWTIRNEDNQLHNFHIHQNPFLVTTINGVPQPILGLFDTITVPSQTGSTPGSVTVKIAFTDPLIAGRSVFHCHVTKHEDKGMMQTIDVVPRRDGAPPATRLPN